MTDLRDLSRVPKTSPRVEAYGSVDELNALLGTVQAAEHDDIDEQLTVIQNHLHVVQTDLAGAENDDEGPRITDDHVDQLEQWIDSYDDELAPLHSFVLPGGTRVGARLHLARTVCRRAERRAIALASSESVNETTIRYLNRLSDALFVLARVVNARNGVEEEHPTY